MNFKLGDKFVEDEIINMTPKWDKKKSESQTGIEPMSSRTPGGRSTNWATRTHGGQSYLSDKCLGFTWPDRNYLHWNFARYGRTFLCFISWFCLYIFGRRIPYHSNARPDTFLDAISPPPRPRNMRCCLEIYLRYFIRIWLIPWIKNHSSVSSFSPLVHLVYLRQWHHASPFLGKILSKIREEFIRITNVSWKGFCLFVFGAKFLSW